MNHEDSDSAGIQRYNDQCAGSRTRDTCTGKTLTGSFSEAAFAVAF